MSWDKRNKKKKWFDVFDEFDDKFDELVDEMFKYFDSAEIDLSHKKKVGPYVYGFSISVGPDGKPEIREFGNVRRTESGRIMSDVREPLIEVMDRGKEVVVIAEVPGVKMEDIHLDIKKNEIHLFVDSGELKYEKVVPVPPSVNTRSAKMEYNNGILEIRLMKK